MSLASCVWLWSPMDCSLPGSSVCGILQARILEWVAIPFSRGSSQPRDRNHISCIAGGFFTVWVTREATSKPLPLDTHYSRSGFSECSSNITQEWLKYRWQPCHTQVITVHIQVRESLKKNHSSWDQILGRLCGNLWSWNQSFISNF